jgi:hypothetical protein
MKLWLEAFSITDFISVGILLTAVILNAFKSIESYVKHTRSIPGSWLA